MKNKTKILSDLSKIAVDVMGAFSGLKKEIETIVKLRVNRTINKMNLVRRDEFEVLKKIVQQYVINSKNKQTKIKKKQSISRKKNKKKKAKK